MKKTESIFEHGKDFGFFLLRLIAGWRLIAGTSSYVFLLKPISEVQAFFQQLQMPFPLLNAYISVYAQFACGLLFIIGLWIRPAAMAMIVNFTVAILAAHLHDPIVKSFSAWALLAMSMNLFFFGAGRISLQKLLKKLYGNFSSTASDIS